MEVQTPRSRSIERLAKQLFVAREYGNTPESVARAIADATYFEDTFVESDAYEVEEIED